MSKLNSSAVPGGLPEGAPTVVGPGLAGRDGRDLIALAQKLARDAERHALLSASLASQAERLMMAGLRQRDRLRPSAGH
jgi:hypothetical protein